MNLTTRSLIEGSRVGANLLTLLFLLTLASTPLALAHEGESHPSKTEHQVLPVTDVSSDMLKTINESYLQNVKSIFQKSCFDCHSNQTKYPWYAKLPGAKQLIASDVTEAKSHLDMGEDFPFKSHGTPMEDLEAIRKAIVENTMPPFRYWILHGESRLSSEEKKTVLMWVNLGIKLLNESGTQQNPK